MGLIKASLSGQTDKIYFAARIRRLDANMVRVQAMTKANSYVEVDFVMPDVVFVPDPGCGSLASGSKMLYTPIRGRLSDDGAHVRFQLAEPWIGKPITGPAVNGKRPYGLMWKVNNRILRKTFGELAEVYPYPHQRGKR